MLKNISNFFIKILNLVLPPRSDFDIVQKLNEENINNLPKAENQSEMDWIHPIFQYKNNIVRAIIWELKYKQNTLPLQHIGKIMYDEIISLVSDILIFDSDAKFLLIPIPITNSRRIERGYNQSEFIAKSILENDLSRTLLYAPQWLWKIRETLKQSQTESKRERMLNLIGSFEADPHVAGKYVILIDDVVTTGSTLSEAHFTLTQVGAHKVFAFTVAH